MSALEHALVPQKHRPSARADFVTVGQSLRPVIIRKVCTYSFWCKGQHFPPLLQPSFCFSPGSPCRREPATSHHLGGDWPCPSPAQPQSTSWPTDLQLERHSAGEQRYLKQGQQKQIWTNSVSSFVSLLCLEYHMCEPEKYSVFCRETFMRD